MQAHKIPLNIVSAAVGMLILLLQYNTMFRAEGVGQVIEIGLLGDCCGCLYCTGYK